MERLIKEETRMTADDETSSALATISGNRVRKFDQKDKHEKKEHRRSIDYRVKENPWNASTTRK